MRIIKRSESAALACWLTALLANIFVPGDCSPLAKTGSEGDDGSSSSVEPSHRKCSHEDLCLTPGCIHAASAVLKNMDLEADPCNDFYRYACGGFLDSTIIPDDKTSSDIFEFLTDKLEEQLRRSIETESTTDEPKPYKLVKNLYKSCMDTDAIEARGLEPLRVILEKLGGWPVVEGDSWNEDDFDWIESIYKIRRLGYSFEAFLGFLVGNDFTNSSRYVIHVKNFHAFTKVSERDEVVPENYDVTISQPDLGIAREFLVEGNANEKVAAYYSFMVDIAVILGVKRDRAEAELQKSLDFEMELAKISVPKEELRDFSKLINPMTLNELTKNYPSVPWENFFNKILPAPLTVEKSETVNVQTPSYFAAFEELISQTPKRIQANYVIWMAVGRSVKYLSSQVRDRRIAYYEDVSGKTQSPPRWKECYGIVAYFVDVAIHAMYARKYFNEGAKKTMVDMVLGLKKQMQRMLQEADWMDEETRNKALEKAAVMVPYIAYPDELLVEKNLEDFYQDLELSENSFFDNFLNASLFRSGLALGKLRETYDKTDWLNHREAATVNAYYSFTDNNIQFPAGILQGAFFSDDRPKYMNYGAIGSVIGHEITHGFDDKGNQFDKTGNIADWWGSSTKKNFIDRKSCIIDQYGNYTVKEVQKKINGINTQGENIADNGGVRAAYHAYKDWAAKNEPERLLPGLNKTQQQMFWISFANVWCSKMRPETLQSQMATDVHSPAEFRISGSVSNMPEFAKDFNCPEGSKMNPAKKCSVW